MTDVDAAEVAGRVRRIVRDMAPIKPETVEGSTTLAVDLGYDSLTLIELATALEDEFGASVPSEEEAADVEHVADVEALVMTMLQQSKSASE